MILPSFAAVSLAAVTLPALFAFNAAPEPLPSSLLEGVEIVSSRVWVSGKVGLLQISFAGHLMSWSCKHYSLKHFVTISEAKSAQWLL